MKRPRHRVGLAGPPRAVSNPVRRRLLRRLRADQRPHSSIELSETLGEPLSSVAYHVQVLQKCGAASLVRFQRVGSARVPLYGPSTDEDEQVLAHLVATETADEGEGWNR